MGIRRISVLSLSPSIRGTQKSPGDQVLSGTQPKPSESRKVMMNSVPGVPVACSPSIRADKIHDPHLLPVVRKQNIDAMIRQQPKAREREMIATTCNHPEPISLPGKVFSHGRFVFAVGCQEQHVACLHLGVTVRDNLPAVPSDRQDQSVRRQPCLAETPAGQRRGLFDSRFQYHSLRRQAADAANATFQIIPICPHDVLKSQKTDELLVFNHWCERQTSGSQSVKRNVQRLLGCKKYFFNRRCYGSIVVLKFLCLSPGQYAGNLMLFVNHDACF